MTLPQLLITGAAVLWLAVLLLPWQPWRTREQFSPRSVYRRSLATLTVLIPARNEAGFIANTLAALRQQGNDLNIILVDDQSGDGTADAARRHDPGPLNIVPTPPLPRGWSGKLWALEQGFRQVETEYTLLLDADIELKEGVIAGLLDKLEREDLQLVSLMARLRMVSGWEKLLMPAFIYFFKLLYPFALANRADSSVAAAAGGCILVRSQALRNIGGPAGLSNELIDDCALAQRIKQKGGRTWIGLTHGAVSHRRYERLSVIWEMVTRTAYTQLRYSPWLLASCIVLLLEAYVIPVAGLFHPGIGRWSAAFALFAMCYSYLPTLRYYGLSTWRVFTLPVAAVLFGLMTLDSARRHLTGQGSSWKERTYTSE